MADPIAIPDIQAGGAGEEKQTSSKKKWIIILLVLVLLGGMGWYGYKRFFTKPDVVEQTIPVAPEAPKQDLKPAAPQSQELKDKEALFGTAQYSSESYKVGDIAVGGEAELILLEDSPEPLAVTGVASPPTAISPTL